MIDQSYIVYCQIESADKAALVESASCVEQVFAEHGDLVNHHSLHPICGSWVLRVESARTAQEILHSILQQASAFSYQCVFIRSLEEQQTTKKLVVFDMDSTLVVGETLDDLAQEIGIGERISAITAQAMRGEIDFATSFKRRVALIAGTPVAIAEKVRDAIHLQKGAIDLCRALRAHGVEIAIATGGFDFFVAPVATQLGARYVQANFLDVQDGMLTGKTKGEIMHAESKRDFMCSLMQNMGLQREQVCAVGDGANDVPMLEAAGFGVAFCAKPLLRETVPNQINAPDFAQLTKHLLADKKSAQETCAS